MLLLGSGLLILVLGIVIGRYPDLLLKNSRQIFAAPLFALKWLLRIMAKHPQICSSFAAGFFVGLLLTGTLSRWFWTFSWVALVLFCLLLIFPETGKKVIFRFVEISGRCAKEIRRFFA